MDKLSFNNKIYNLLKKDVYNYKRQNLNDELLIKKIEKQVTFAWENFPGILTDFEFENYLYNLSKQSEIVSYKRADVLNKNVVLHYATELYNSGGHTRVIKDWITNDSRKSNLFISQNHSIIPNFISDLDCRVEKANKSDLRNRVRQFAAFIEIVKPAFIIVHNHPDDLIPTLIKPYVSDIPFIFYNHADFQFSLGSTFTDLGVSLFKASKIINDKYRFSSSSIVLPLFVEKFKNKPKLQKKKSVEIVLMASFSKFKPYKEWNLFYLLKELILNERIKVINVVGISEEQAIKYFQSPIPDKIKFLGIINNPKSFLIDADIYIESFPMGTGLGTLQSIALGAYPIFNPTSLLIYPNGAALNHFPLSVETEYDGVKTMNDFKLFIDKKILMVANGEIDNTWFKEFLWENNHFKWRDKINAVYNAASLKGEYKIVENKFLTGKNVVDFAETRNNYAYKRLFPNLSNYQGLLIIFYYSRLNFFTMIKSGDLVLFIRMIYKQIIYLIKQNAYTKTKEK